MLDEMRAALTLVAVVGCGSDPTTVLVHTGDVNLVAVDPDGDGNWVALPDHSDQRVEVGERWAVVSVCGSSDAPEVIVEYHHADDDAEVWLPCRAPDGEVHVFPVTVAGLPSPNYTTFVDLGWYGGGVVQGTSGAVHAYPGTWSLSAGVAGADPPIVLLQRGVVVDASTPASLALDFASDGFALDLRPVTFSGSIGNDCAFANIYPDGEEIMEQTWGRPLCDHVYTLPADRVVPADIQVAQATSYRGDGYGVAVDRSITDAPIDIAFPTPLDAASVSFAGLPSASWQSADAWDAYYLFAQQGNITQRASAWTLSDYDTGAMEARFPDLTSVPGWRSTWALNPTITTYLTIELVRGNVPDDEEALYQQSFNEPAGAASPPVPRHLLPR